MKIIKKLSLLLAITVISILCLAISSSAAWEKVNEDGNIVLDVKPRGMMIIVK